MSKPKRVEYPRPTFGFNDLGVGEISDVEDLMVATDDAPEEYVRREGPEVVWQRVAWICKFYVHAHPEDRGRLSSEQRRLFEKVLILQAESKNPDPDQLRALQLAFEKLLPSGRWTSEHVRGWYDKLHAEIGCPNCEWGIAMDDGLCGGRRGDSPATGCGYRKET